MTAPISSPASPTATRPSTVGQRPAFDAEQKTKLIATVAGLLRGLVVGESAAWPAEESELASAMVWGSFVSLKRGRHLRSCSGMMGQLVPLQHAVSRAAERTVWEDERFPPISPTELDHLEMEVWLLFNPQQVQARGEERANAITLGTHGIQVFRGQAGGLFLPSVSTENNWDAVTFLDRVCMKAGLPATAWKEDETVLLTFEGEVFHSAVGDVEGVRPGSPPSPFRAEDLATIVTLCRANIYNLLIGAVPRYFGGAPDGMLNGVVLTVQRAGSPDLAYFSRIALRPGVPLQAALFGLVQSAAQFLASHGTDPQAIANLPIGLTFLHDPILHGTVADPHLAGFEPKSRALLVLERNKAGLVFDPSRSAKELVEETASQARVSQPEVAGMFSLSAMTNVERLVVSTAPKPVRGAAERPPAMAGKFYDADPAKLSQVVDRLLAGDRQPEHWPAAMVPHAGLQFSGRIAADVLKRIEIPKTVIVIGPSHTGQGMDWAVAPHQTWVLPGTTIASDFILARKLCQAIDGLEMDAAAHQNEHAIEVELPLLARLAPESKVVGITVAHGDLAGCRRFARGLADVIRDMSSPRSGARRGVGGEGPPLLLISSDMNHFATDTENRRLDAIALEALESGDPEELFHTVTRHHISMCGMLPAVIVLETLKLLGGFKKAVRTGYATSADVTGDKSRVVGYAGMLLK